jgi:5-hydroxyisourate hydrolase
VTLYRGEQVLATGLTAADGRIASLGDRDLDAGVYRIDFDVAAYFAANGRAAPFLRRVSLEFVVAASETRYHVPLLLSPYACTSYRGS